MVLDLGIFAIDFTPLFEAAAQSPVAGFWYIFIKGGWIPIAYVLLWGFKELWLFNKQQDYWASWRWTLLAIDIPKDNIQTPKAVENIFSQLAGAHSTPNLIEKYLKGKIQEPFSCEIASHGGHVFFYVRTTEQFRDLVEAAIYAQYPEAEITEAEDYTHSAPVDFPNKEYDLWGTEFKLQNKQPYPIRTYPEFEHQLSQEFMDPMAAMLEALSKIGPDEHIWLQIIVRPISDDWKEEGVKIAKKLVGAKVEEKSSLIEKTLGASANILEETMMSIFEAESEQQTVKTDKSPISIMQFLTPGERRVIEAIQFKISKIGFATKFRVVYWAKKSSFHKGRGVSPVIGAIKQFNTLDLNGFKPDKKLTTKINYFFIKRRLAARQRGIIRRYKGRGFMSGSTPFVLNAEELASIFHFPVSTVKAPLVRKTESKRAEPPIGLPMRTEKLEAEQNEELKPRQTTKKAASKELPKEEISDNPPANLPTA